MERRTQNTKLGLNKRVFEVLAQAFAALHLQNP